MDKICQSAAELMLEIDSWRERWRVEVDGCVFKVDIKGYPKHGTERDLRLQAEIEQEMKEFTKENPDA